MPLVRRHFNSNNIDSNLIGHLRNRSCLALNKNDQTLFDHIIDLEIISNKKWYLNIYLHVFK